MPPSSSLRPAPPLGTTIAGRYVLTRFLRSGGMGAVYEATTEEEERVAVKVLLNTSAAGRGGSGTSTARFWREALLGAKVESSHVVSVVDSGFDDGAGLPYLVMPLLVGVNLDELVERLGPLHPTLAVRIVRQACRGVAAAHDAGVIHRDIKGANVFLDHDVAGRVNVRILDFGIAKGEEGAEVTRTGSLLGTPHFMSPEQIADAKRVDERADVWSLAITLYHALSGGFPFDDAESFAKLALAINTQAPRHLLELAPWVDPALATVVHGALLRDREARCPTVAALADALGPFNDGGDDLEVRWFEPLDKELRGARHELGPLPTRWSPERPREPLPALPDTPADALLGKTVGGRFTLLRALGMGGMGAVYEAADKDGGRVALKVIRPELANTGSSALKRFMREGEVVAGIESDHVVRVLHADNDVALGLPYIAMELIDGVDLERLVKSQGPLAPKTTARLFVQACRGLRAAHEKGYLHRDVKPSNLMLSRQLNDTVLLKVCDFGIAKAVINDSEESATTTQPGKLVGSPMYMSPEQAMSAKDLDARTDVWSLGAALYETLTGVPPWLGREGVGQLVMAICSQELVPVSDRAPWVPKGLSDVVGRAMHRDLTQRYASVAELEAALEPFTGDAVTVRPAEVRAISERERSSRSARAGTEPPRAKDFDSKSVTLLTSDTGERAVSSPTPAAATTVPPPRRRLSPAIGIAVVVGLGGVVAYASSTSTRSATDVSAAPPSSSAVASAIVNAPAERAKLATVKVSPDDATVTVDGAARPLAEGRLTLEGAAGARFKIVATAHGETVAENVILAADGTPSVSEIVVPQPKSAASTSSASASNRASTSVAAPPTATAKASAASAPTATPTATSPLPANSWR